MRQREFVKGSTAEEKFKSINKVFEHMAIRLRKKVVGIMPPSPLFAYVTKASEDGVIARFVLPAKGKVTKIAMAVKKYAGKDGADFECGIVTQGNEFSYKFKTKKPVELVDLDKDVEPGDVVYLSISDPDLAEGISIGMLYEIGRANSIIKHFLIDELEALEEDGETITSSKS